MREKLDGSRMWLSRRTHICMPRGALLSCITGLKLLLYNFRQYWLLCNFNIMLGTISLQYRSNSLGLPRVYNQKSKLVFFSKCQTTVYRNISPVYGTFDEISYWGHVEGTTKPRGVLPILSRYTSFWQKYDVLIFKMKKTGWHWFPSQIYGTSASLRCIQQNQEGDTDVPFTVIPLYGKKSRGFSFVLLLDDVFSF